MLAIAAFALSAAPATAAAPIGRYTVRVNTDDGGADDTVLDNRTGLEWQRDFSDDSYFQSGARAYCMGLAIAGGNWRLPSIQELLSIVDPKQLNPATDPTAFPRQPDEDFWSTTPVLGIAQTTLGWAIDLRHGNTFRPDVNNIPLLARCVRSQ